MQFRTIVKDPKVLEQYFSPLFLNLKEGECLEEYRQNKAVDDFLNAIPKTYEAEDLKAFYEKTGIKVEHQRFEDYWSYLFCNRMGKIPGYENINFFKKSLDEMIELMEGVYSENDTAIELREGDWERWKRWEELVEKADNALKKQVMKAYHQRARDMVESEQFHELGQFEHNEYYAVLITKCSQMGMKFGIPSENLQNSGIFTIVLKNYETPELDEMIAEINEVLTEKLENWEEHWLRSVFDELERCREYMDERNETLIKEYVQRIYERYCYE